MAFGQINTGFGSWFSSTPFSGWFATGTTAVKTTSTPRKTTTNATDYTYNSRYPWFDKDDYDRLVEIVKAQGVTGSNFTQLMDEAYQYYYPQVLNKHKLDERGAEINKGVYENGNNLVNGDPKTTETFKRVDLAQKAKQKFGISYDMNDDELLDLIISGTPDGANLYAKYLKDGDPQIFYAAGIYDQKTTQWGVKSMINPASEGGILPEKTEWLNPIGAATETIDNAAGKFADKLTVRGTKSAENLKAELENMSQDEIDAYREQFRKAVGEKKIWTAYTTWDTIVERLWNGIKGNVYYPEDEEAFYKWLIDKKISLWQSLIGADGILTGESNPNVIRFFSNIPASAVKTFTATVRGMTNPYDTLKGLYKLAATEEWHQAIIDRYGSWDALAKAMNEDPVGVADDILAVAELWANIVGGGMKVTGKITWNANLVNQGWALQWAIGSANDALAQKTVGSIYWWLDNLAGMTDNKVVQGVNRYVQDVSSAGKLAQDAKDVYDAAKPAVKNFISEVITKTVGVDEWDRKFIRENADLVNQYLDGKKSVETVYDDVKKKIAGQELKTSKMGQEYDKLAQSWQKAKTAGLTDNMKDTLSKNKITIDADGNLQFDKLSKYNATQQKAIQDAWQVIKDAQAAGEIDAGTILDLRQKLDDKINWEWKSTKSSAVDKSTERLIKEMRNTIDTTAKSQIKGLEKLDAKYSAAIEQLNEIKKDWFDSNGNLKDNARSKLRNLTKAGNEERLARLKKVIPWIDQDLKALDVWLTVQKASSQGVGQYAKGGLITAWITTAIHNPVLWIPMAVAWVFATPKNFVRLIEMYPDIWNKIQLGVKLSAGDISRMQALASRLEDGTLEE